MNRIHAFAIASLVAFGFSASAALAAEPTLHEVYQAVQAGQLKQAEAMMDQVLRDHPGSAKAHFVEAEIQAKEGNASKAREEFATAERLAPGLPFAKPEAVAELRRLIEPAKPLSPVLGAAALPAAGAPGFPWGTLLIGLALVAAIVFFIRAMNRPRVLPAASGAYGAGQFGNPQPYGQPGMGPAGMGPVAGGGMGSGILGGLATGAAVGAGMVAGEALMHRVLGGGNAANAAPVDSIADTPITPATGYDMGGDDFGVSDAGSWDDGSGGSDWN